MRLAVAHALECLVFIADAERQLEQAAGLLGGGRSDTLTRSTSPWRPMGATNMIRKWRRCEDSWQTPLRQ